MRLRKDIPQHSRGATELFENVPPHDDKFTGREDYLTEIHRLLTGSDKVAPGKPVALYGLGGTGKSSLAAEYAHRYANDYAGVWWAPAEQRTLLVSSLATLGGKLIHGSRTYPMMRRLQKPH